MVFLINCFCFYLEIVYLMELWFRKEIMVDLEINWLLFFELIFLVVVYIFNEDVLILIVSFFIDLLLVYCNNWRIVVGL